MPRKNNVLKEFYFRLEQERIAHGLSKRQFGVNINKGKNWWQQCTKDTRAISFTDAVALMKYYGVELDDLD